METPNHARALVRMKEGTIKIEGTEQFVTNQLTRLRLESHENPHHSSFSSEQGFSDTTGPRLCKAAAIGTDEKPSGIISNSEFALLKALPGNNMKHKTVSAALLVSYANWLQGVEQTPLEVIRKACKEQACHDTNNFSATLKKESKLFEHSGATYIRLTEAGRTLAKNLAKNLIVNSL